jgi:hypothetical protein
MKRNMLIILSICLSVLAVVAVAIFMVGTALPEKHTARVEGMVALSADATAARIRNVIEHPNWRHQLKRVEIKQSAADGVQYIEHGKHGPLKLWLKEVEIGAHFIATVLDETDFGGDWSIRITPINAQRCRVEITESGWIKPVVFRVMSRFAFGYDANIQRYLADLQAIQK